MSMSHCSRRAILGAVVFSMAASAGAATCPTAACDPARLARRTLRAVRLQGPAPAIDGVLDDGAWRNAALATGFVESRPRPAAAAGLESEARVLVDDQALYVALTYLDPRPETIQAPLARRDDETTSDWAFVEIDSRYDRRSSFSFGVNPRGVQVDGLWFGDTLYDFSWNAVWEAAARPTAEGWTAEFRIPFSQLAFSLPAGSAELLWGVNFYRFSPGHGESSNWSPRYSGLGGIVSNFNDLVVPAPPSVRRLEATPFVAPRLGRDRGDTRASLEAGADFRVGLGSTFSLTGTVLPDFGQVEADPSQVNLTSFELFQAERRPFFLEGLDVFRLDTALAFSSRASSFASEAPFYSRRVGRAPRGRAPFAVASPELPAATTLLGAAKLSGQTAGGWTLGLFTAASDREEGHGRGLDGSAVSWMAEPRSLFSVGRASRSFNGGHTSLALFAADVHRLDLSEALASQYVRDAASAGLEAQHRFHHGNYQVRGWVLGSQLTGDAAAIARVAESPQHLFQRRDAPRLHDRPYGTVLRGLAAETRLSRIGGSLRWDLSARAVSPGFDVNETGFQRNSDWLLLAGGWRYERFRPGRWIRAWAVGSENLGLGWSWAGEPRARVLSAFGSVDLRSYWTLKLTATHELPALSMDRLRGGPALLLPGRDALAATLVTDTRRPTYASLDAGVAREPASGSSAATLSPFLNVRSSDRVQWSVGPTWQAETVGWQYVGAAGAAGAPDYLVGRVRQRTLALTLRADVIFTPRLSLQFYAQPFATAGRYDAWQRLSSPRDPRPERRFVPLAAGQVRRDGARLDLDLDGDGGFEAALPWPGGQERALDASAVLRWEYRPGSYLTAVWSHRRDASVGEDTLSPAHSLRRLFHDPASNVLLLKASLRVGS
jgi:hypothetical protein